MLFFEQEFSLPRNQKTYHDPLFLSTETFAEPDGFWLKKGVLCISKGIQKIIIWWFQIIGPCNLRPAKPKKRVFKLSMLVSKKLWNVVADF
jgi:hypothetical protein